MADTVLILAAGDAARWNGQCKHLAQIGAETVIGRIARQVLQCGYAPIVVTHRRDLGMASAVTFAPLAHDTLLDTLLSTRELWRGRVYVLLGDVVFSDEALDLALYLPWTPAVVGDCTENFALVFDAPDYARIEQAARDAKAAGGSKLWDLYETLADCRGRNRYDVLTPPYAVIQDWSTDVDSPEEHAALVKLMSEKGLLDAEGN